MMQHTFVSRLLAAGALTALASLTLPAPAAAAPAPLRYPPTVHHGIVRGLRSIDPPTATPIKHVIIVVMENRTFDNVFNGFPGADTVQVGYGHLGQPIALKPTPYYGNCDPDHSHGAWLKDYNGGRMNGFDTTPASCVGTTADPTYPYGFLPRQAVAPYWNLASQFALADRMFASQSGPSYPGHLYLIAGQTHNETDDPNALEWGCDAPAGTTTPTLGPDGQINGSEFPCLDIPTLGDLLDQHGISWAYYSNNADYDATGKKSELSTMPYDAIWHIRFGPDWQRNMRGSEAFEFLDVLNGNLPSVAWFNPPLPATDHPQDTTNFGPEYVALLANSLMQTPYWNDTAIFVTWDDHGGWYDHVSPPQLDRNGLGFRVPLILISKYAKRGYVSHVQHEFASILKFCEENYGVGSLNATDVRADDLADMFDFSAANAAKPATPVPNLSVGLPYFLNLPLDTKPVDY